MRVTRRSGAILAIGATVVTAAALVGPSPEPGTPGDLLVFTQVAVAGDGAEPDWRYPARSRIVALDLADLDAEPVVLTPGLAAARAADVHFDGRRIVFAGRREVDGPWQIWEAGLDGAGSRLLVERCQRCTDPVYRPDDGVVYVAPSAEDSSRMATYTVAPGGDRPVRITHHPLSDESLGLVSDGRVLIATGTADSATRYYAVRHDGTGAELMYGSPDSAVLTARAHETGERGLVFLERTGAGDRVVSISQAYPETSREVWTAPAGAELRSVFPAPDGTVIVSARRDGDALYGLWRTDPGSGVSRVRAPAPGFHLVEPILARARARPLGFVSATDPGAGSGTFFGTNARLTGMGSRDTAAAVLRVSTPDGRLGDVPLAGDGSFHVELPADVPVRLETLDADGITVRGPSAWIWLRPGEMRGCVGCHESRTLAPENRLPEAAARPPVSLVDGRAPGAAGEGTP